MWRASLGFGILLVAALAVGATAASVIPNAAAAAPGSIATAAGPRSSVVPLLAPAQDAGRWCRAFRAAFAAELGVSEDELVAAARDAATATIDRALADGSLQQAAADRLKTRLADTTEKGGCSVLAGGRVAHPGPGGRLRLQVLQAAAEALGVEPAELRRELRAGSTLPEIAGARNLDYATVTEQILGAVRRDLDAVVKAGTLPQRRADAVLEKLAAALIDGRLSGGPKGTR